MSGCNHLDPKRVAEHNPGRPFEVVGVRRLDDTEEIIGWVDDEDGGKLLEGAKLWPRYKRAFVRPASKPEYRVQIEGEFVNE